MSAKAVFDFLKLVTPTNGHSFESTSDTLTRLKFIGTLEPGEKLDVRNLRIESNTLFTPIKRLFFGEGREATFAFTYSTIERAFAILYSLAATDKVSDSLLCANILHDMNKAIAGLMNLQATYRDDKMFACNVETLVQTIQAKMLEVQQKYPDIWKLTLTTNTPPQSPALSSNVSNIQPTNVILDTTNTLNETPTNQASSIPQNVSNIQNPKKK